MWQMAAPAFAAPMQASAISCGVTGSAGFCARVGKLPVTAQVKMVGFITVPRDRRPRAGQGVYSGLGNVGTGPHKRPMPRCEPVFRGQYLAAINVGSKR